MNAHPLCQPDHHQFSRRQWLGGMAGSALAAGGLIPIPLNEPQVAILILFAKRDAARLFLQKTSLKIQYRDAQDVSS